MQKAIVIVGLNHRTAPVEVRERVAFDPAALQQTLKQVVALPKVDEGVILSTCNRVEVVAASPQAGVAVGALQDFLLRCSLPGGDRAIAPHLYAHVQEEAVRHLFRVAASLDSLVVGEPQILGQLKESYLAGKEAGTVGSILHRLFHRSFSVAKRVRSETGIGSRAVSVGSVAVEMARRIFDRLDDKVVLLIGAGETGQMVMRQLQQGGVKSFMVTNRTFSRAVDLAGQFRGSPIRFEDLPRYLTLADVVVGCATSQEVLIRPAAIAEVLKERKRKAMFFIDLGVPRNFDSRINEMDQVYLYDIDDLEGVARENLQGRTVEAVKAEVIVDEEVGGFLQWLDSLENVPTIIALKDKLDAIRRGELEKSLGAALKGLSDREKQAIEGMTLAMVNKILHSPIGFLKRRGDDEEDTTYLEALRKLFDLEEK